MNNHHKSDGQRSSETCCGETFKCCTVRSDLTLVVCVIVVRRLGSWVKAVPPLTTELQSVPTCHLNRWVCVYIGKRWSCASPRTQTDRKWGLISSQAWGGQLQLRCSTLGRREEEFESRKTGQSRMMCCKSFEVLLREKKEQKGSTVSNTVKNTHNPLGTICK